jgi:hypothetical protein
MRQPVQNTTSRFVSVTANASSPTPTKELERERAWELYLGKQISPKEKEVQRFHEEKWKEEEAEKKENTKKYQEDGSKFEERFIAKFMNAGYTETQAKRLAEREKEIAKLLKEAEEAVSKAKSEAEEAAAKAAEASKEAEEAKKAAAPPPPPEEKKAPIRFHDAIGRKFNFPFHLCTKWAVGTPLPSSRFY